MSNNEAKASLDDIKMSIEKSEGADVILFKYFGEIENTILK